MIDQDLINKNKFLENRVLITGQEGMVGSSIYGYLKKRLKIIDCKRKDLDFTTKQKVV